MHSIWTVDGLGLISCFSHLYRVGRYGINFLGGHGVFVLKFPLNTNQLLVIAVR